MTTAASSQDQLKHPIKGNICAKEIDDVEALTILSSMEAIGPVKIRQLIHIFGTALEALLAPPEEIANLPGFSPKLADQWKIWKTDGRWKNNLILAEKEQVQIISFTCPNYPKQLLELSDPPLLLYIKGNINLLGSNCLSIVGTRQASIYGNETAKKFAYELASMGYVILSGLARGVDTSAHIGALESGKTAAVIGSGLSHIYPAENRFLAEKIGKEGCLISEFAMATPPDRQNFPLRNRIVSALSAGIILIEAPIKSGAMITMQIGRGMGKKLFALPGRIDGNFGGNHFLIKSGFAQLIDSSMDIAQSYEDLFAGVKKGPPKQKTRIALDKEEVELLQLLPIEELDIESIVKRTKLPISALNVLLMSLVLKGAIKEFPGKVYKKQV